MYLVLKWKLVVHSSVHICWECLTIIQTRNLQFAFGKIMFFMLGGLGIILILMFHLRKYKGSLIGVSVVEDYVYRPDELDHLSLYDWVCWCYQEKSTWKKKTATSRSCQSANTTPNNDDVEVKDISLSNSLDDFIVPDELACPLGTTDNPSSVSVEHATDEISDAFAELDAILDSLYPTKVTTDVPKGSYPFQKEHPLSSTHHIVY